MLHLRLIVPPDRTKETLRLLETTLGTAHLVVLPGAARDPQGDVVLCDVAREAADTLLEELRALGLDTDGSICVEPIDLSLSRRAEQAEREAPGEAADAVVWESLTEATHEESTLSLTYLAFLSLATMIAACGVVLDNAILIVGAMAVGPEFGPLAGVCTAVVRRAPRLAWRSVLALIAGFVVAMAVTVGFSYFMDAVHLFDRQALDRERPNTAFIWQPDLFSFVVAVLAGCAGMLSLTSAKSGALVGVAISVTTVPAAANAAVAFVYDDYAQTWGSSKQLLLNLAGIVVAGVVTLAAQKLLWARQQRRQRERAREVAGVDAAAGARAPAAASLTGGPLRVAVGPRMPCGQDLFEVAALLVEPPGGQPGRGAPHAVPPRPALRTVPWAAALRPPTRPPRPARGRFSSHMCLVTEPRLSYRRVTQSETPRFRTAPTGRPVSWSAQLRSGVRLLVHDGGYRGRRFPDRPRG